MKWKCAWERQEQILSAVVGPWSLVASQERNFLDVATLCGL
jgi:hypothetical protein